MCFLLQVVICVSQIYWTQEVHEAIRAGPHGLKEYHEKLTKQVGLKDRFFCHIFFILLSTISNFILKNYV